MNTSLHPGASLATLFALPWRTVHASLRWLMVVLMAGSLILTLVLGIHSPKPFFRAVGLGMCCASVGLAWAFWLSASVLTAQDARRLRVPGAERVVAQSLIVHGLLDVAVPTLVLGALGANALLAGMCLALAVCGGLQRLTERRERWRAQRLLRDFSALLMGFLMAEGLPLLWPALAAWKPAVFGVCLGLAFAATREWGVPRFPPVASEDRP